MATDALGNNLTMLEVSKLLQPDGGIETDIVDLLSKRSPTVATALTVQGNLPDGHRFSYRAVNPTVALRDINSPVATSKSRHGQSEEKCSNIEGYSETDKLLLALYDNPSAIRSIEDRAFVSSMTHEAERLIFDGDPSDDPKEFMGLAPRYASTTGVTGDQVIVSPDTEDGTDGTSFYFIVWDEASVALVRPKNLPGTLQVRNLGEDTIRETNGNYQAEVTHFQWMFGLMVKDWRQASRVQVDKSLVVAGTTDATDIINMLVDGYHRVEAPEAGKICGYCSRFFYAALHKAAIARVASSTLSIDKDIENGRPVMKLFGVPIYRTDAIGTSEAHLS